MALADNEVTPIPANAQKILDMVNNIRDDGDGPGGTPHGLLRDLAYRLVSGFNGVASFVTGSKTVGDHAVDMDILLDFAPKGFLAYVVNGTTNYFVFKLASMSATNAYTAVFITHTVATDAIIMTLGNAVKFQNNAGTNANAACVHTDLLAANSDVVHFLIFG